MYKIIACDLDETLLNGERHVSKKNVEAIKKANALGVKFVPATGRGFRSIDGTLRELGLYEKPEEYVISFNGGAITENKGDHLLYFQGISFDFANQLFTRGLSYDVCIHIYTKDTVYAYNVFEEERSYLAGRMEITEFFEPSIDFLKQEDIVKVLYVNTNHAYLTQIAKELEDITKDTDVSYSSNRYLEFNYKGVNKGAGLLSLANLLGVKREETIAIGDNFNDLSMIQTAGLGIGVKNSVEGIKKDCDYITKTTNEEDAIAEVIETFIL